MKKIILFMLPLFLCQCSTMGGSIGLGAGIGAGAGFTTSKIAEYNTKGTLVLTASGALIGGVLGALLHKDPPSQIPVSSLNGVPPPLKDADTDMIFVPDSIQDGKYVEGHRVWTIRSPAHWQLYPANSADEKKKEGKNGTSGKESKANGESNKKD